MQRVRFKHSTVQDLQKAGTKPRKNFYTVEDGLKAEATRKQYRWHFNAFLKYAKIPVEAEEELLKLPVRDLEALLIEYLYEFKHKEQGRKHSTLNNAMHAVLHFCDMNDLLLNKRKVSRFLPPDEDNVIDRAYTYDEIRKLLKVCDERFRVVILLMCSSGMRVGAIPDLLIGDLEEKRTADYVKEGSLSKDEYPTFYKVMVYNRSKKDRYYTFVTPECARAINDYLEYRKRFGETIKKTAPLIREQFNIDDKFDAANPRKITLGALVKIIERAIVKAGINTTHKVMKTNGFRKFAITMMKQAKVDFTDREYLVGHKMSRGLDVNYDRTDEEDRLTEWFKAVNLLTINSKYRTELKLKRLEGEQSKEIARLNARLQSYENWTKEAAKWIKEQQSNIKAEYEKLDRIVESPEFQRLKSKNYRERAMKDLKELNVRKEVR